MITVMNKLYEEFLSNQEISKAIDYALPSNYSFEIHKSLWKIKSTRAKHVGLQFPEGLLIFSTQIAIILKTFTSHPIQITILGDVTYGACCIDDLNSSAIGVDLLIHYGHSCLVPIYETCLDHILYIFVDILIDYQPLLDAIINVLNVHGEFSVLNQPSISDLKDFNSSINELSSLDRSHYPCIALLGTIQYCSVLHYVAKQLENFIDRKNIIIPQKLPLSSGEVLGCTSPLLDPNIEIVFFIADGRFHMESVMIQNPNKKFFRYDPFSKKVFHEKYNYEILHQNRKQAIMEARKSRSIGLILSTLGRQGSIGILERIQDAIHKSEYKIQITIIMMSEISPDRLKTLSTFFDAFIQVGCPRLSIDWGTSISNTPVLTPYEAFVAFSNQNYLEVYPMDYYSKNGGPWSNYYMNNRLGSLKNEVESKRLNTEELKKMEIRKKLQSRNHSCACQK